MSSYNANWELRSTMGLDMIDSLEGVVTRKKRRDTDLNFVDRFSLRKDLVLDPSHIFLIQSKPWS